MSGGEGRAGVVDVGHARCDRDLEHVDTSHVGRDAERAWLDADDMDGLGDSDTDSYNIHG